jgi:hypothetical protein
VDRRVTVNATLHYQATAETVTLTLAPEELLALAAVLDAADNFMLEAEGVREEVRDVVDEIYGQVEAATRMIYGDDWDVLTSVDPEGVDDDGQPDLFDDIDVVVF